MKFLYYGFFIILITGCNSIRDSAGVSRKSIDEYRVVENPPLIIPPDFNLLPPDQLVEKNIDNIENDLAKEILFGLGTNELKTQNQISTMNQILVKTDALDISSSIRDEIDIEFAKQMNTTDILNFDWQNDDEVLNAIEESKRLRNDDTKEEIISDNVDSSDKKNTICKKKKRFFFF